MGDTVRQTEAYALRSRLGKGMRIVGIPLVILGMVMHGTGPLGSNIAAEYVMFAGWAMATIGWAMVGVFEKLSLVRLIQDLPTAKIRSAPQGYVELRGVARSNGTTRICPKCGLTCLWFQYNVHANKRTYRESPAEEGASFALEDGTGRCNVVAAGAELFSSRRREGQHAHVCAGDPIHVLGEFRTGAPGAKRLAQSEDHGSRRREEALRRKLLALKYDARRMAVFDVDKDGKLDEREVEAAYRMVEHQAAEQARSEHADSALVQPATDADRLPFVIFVGNEAGAIASARWAVAGRVAMSVALIAFGAMWIPGVQGQGERHARKAVAAEAKAAPAKREKSPQRIAYDLLMARKYDEAIAAYDELIEQDPRDGELYYNRAFAHGRSQHDELARADVESACALGVERACAKLAELDAPSP